jgi:general secretion pathway protein J
MKRLTALRGGAAGFTLVELLLAVTLMSILLGLAYGGLRAATRATQQGQLLLEESGGVRTTHQFIRRQFSQMQPLPFEVLGDEGLGEVRILFVGDDMRVQFVGPMPGYLGSGGPQVQVLELVPGPDGGELLFSHALLQEFTPEALLDREPIVLIDGIESAAFEYLGRDANGELTGWMSNWDQPSSLPLMVRLDVVFSPESRVIWPLLAAGPRVDPASLNMRAEELRPYQEAIRKLIDAPVE